MSKQYLRALTDYVQSGSEDSLFYASLLGKKFQNMPLERIIALHEENMQILISNVESEEAVKYYHLSFIFLSELMVHYRLNNHSLDSNDRLIGELREMLYKTNRSFQMVKNKYENVLQHMDSGIALFDSEGFLTFINVQMGKLLKVPRKTMLGYNLPGLLRHPQISRVIRKLLLRTYTEMFKRRTRYYEIVNEDGRHLLLTATYGEELDGDVLVSVKDVTEYKNIEQTAYQNDKLAMLGKISASIAHEIRNPLTSIRGFIQLLHPDLIELGKEEYVQIMLDEIDRANDIIHEFLNSSKPSAPNKREISVQSLLREAVMLFESEALLKGCEIAKKTADPDLRVWIDVKQMKQVILNIIRNALDAVSGLEDQRKGLILIEAEQKGSKVHIYIRDNGKGMDHKTLSKLFDPFFTTKQEGTGLGLSVSYRIMRNHGGTISVESEVGKGTQFRLTLPVNELQ